MPTTRTVTVASSGGDYTSLSAAISGESKDLVSLDRQLIIECEAFQDTTNVTVNGFTTDATRNIIIRAASGHEHGGVLTDGYYLSESAAFRTLLSIQDDYVTVEGIGIKTTANSTCYESASSASELRNCIIEQSGASSRSAVKTANRTASADLTTVENCLIDSDSTGIECAAFRGAHIRNCTVINASTGINANSSGNASTIQNTVCFDCTTPFDVSGSALVASHNAADDTSAPGTSSVDNITSAAFADYAGGDYSPASSGALDGAGTDLSAQFTDDITGATRSQWDIGAYGIVASGGTFSIALSIKVNTLL